MNHTLNGIFLPVLTTQAGRCLTFANWQEVNINDVALDLTALLMKPGYDFLNSASSLANYLGWDGHILLNASLLHFDEQGGYLLRSEYDGSRKHYTFNDIWNLILSLKPTRVLLPQGIHKQNKRAWLSLPENSIPFFSIEDEPECSEQRQYGIYFILKDDESFVSIQYKIQELKGIPCCVVGDLNLQVMKQLAASGARYLVSDRPAQDAYQGLIYSREGKLSLTDGVHRSDFCVIDEQCSCPTCKQNLTRAYLCHLFEHTPLLCHRFLIQHHIYFVNHAGFNDGTTKQ